MSAMMSETKTNISERRMPPAVPAHGLRRVAVQALFGLCFFTFSLIISIIVEYSPVFSFSLSSFRFWPRLRFASCALVSSGMKTFIVTFPVDFSRSLTLRRCSSPRRLTLVELVPPHSPAAPSRPRERKGENPPPAPTQS